MTADPTISPDGNWRWDGTSWQPNNTAAVGAATSALGGAPALGGAGGVGGVTQTPPPDAGTTAAPATTTAAAAVDRPGANVGDVVNVNVDGDSFLGYVVGVVDGSAEEYIDGDGNQQTRVLRDAGVLVSRLPDPVFVSNAALRD